jgi:hypothetical protein
MKEGHRIDPHSLMHKVCKTTNALVRIAWFQADELNKRRKTVWSFIEVERQVTADLLESGPPFMA